MDNLDQIVDSAKATQKQWRAVPVEKRGELLNKVAGLMDKNKREIAETISDEMKKPVGEAIVDCEFTTELLRFYAQRASGYLAPEIVKDGVSLHFEPIGVVGAIKPWNFPFDTPLWCIAPAIMAGNSVILKPSPITPKTAEWIGRLFVEAGSPDGLVQVIDSSDEAGTELVRSDVDVISFTGSTKVGKEIAMECAKSGKRYNLEMGGKDFAIVLADCDIDKTIDGIVLHGYMNNGQACTSIERVLIDKKIYDFFVGKLIEKVKTISPSSSASRDQFEIVKRQLGETNNGRKTLCGGKIIDEKQWIIEPTIIECHNDEASVWKNETFGPVLAIRPFDSLEKAIRVTNNTNYGLGASVWTKNADDFEKIANALEVGMVWQNDANLPILEGNWEGWKDSGVGCSLGKYGIRAYTKTKQITRQR